MTRQFLGLPGDNTFSNYQEANRAFWRQTAPPLVVRLQKSFQAWLQPGYAPFRFDYNADRLEALADERESEWARVGKAGFLTLDEQREAVGYGPAPKDARGSSRAWPWKARRRHGIGEDLDGKEDGDGNAVALADHCEEEWSWARNHCASLLAMPNPPRGLTGGYDDVESCARGFVSEACGGNSV